MRPSWLHHHSFFIFNLLLVLLVSGIVTVRIASIVVLAVVVALAVAVVSVAVVIVCCLLFVGGPGDTKVYGDTSQSDLSMLEFRGYLITGPDNRTAIMTSKPPIIGWNVFVSVLCANQPEASESVDLCNPPWLFCACMI